MDTPRWLRRTTVEAIHQRQLSEHGGSNGIRDSGLLESALARPLNLHAYDTNASITQLAAAYGFGLAKNHPFVDGNKRVAWVAMRTFLSINGIKMNASKIEKYQTMYAVAAGSSSEGDLAKWLEEHCS